VPLFWSRPPLRKLRVMVDVELLSRAAAEDSGHVELIATDCLLAERTSSTTALVGSRMLGRGATAASTPSCATRKQSLG
jgi:hypothetical protein